MDKRGWAVSKRRLGQATRGKTERNRLRRVDNFLLQYDPGLLRRNDGPFAGAFYVDLGYGAEAWTTLESAVRLRRLNPVLPVLGVEIDPERVAAAQPYTDELTWFRLGGFNLPLGVWPDGTTETVRLVRAFNVLRQYDERAVAEAWTQMMRPLLPGGLLIEGTSDPYGRIWAANLIRKIDQADGQANAAQNSDDWQLEALVFSTNFRTGFDPAQFQERLPKNLIHCVVPGEAIYDFFAAWKQAAASTAPYRVFGLRQWFTAAAQRLAQAGYAIDRRRKWLHQGYLILSWH